MDEMFDHPPFRRRVETNLLVDALKSKEIGEMLTYAECSVIAGVDIENTHRRLLDSARRILMRDHRMNYEPVPGKGVMRANDGETMRSIDSMFLQIHNKAKRAKVKANCVDYPKLTIDEQSGYLARVSLANVIKNTTRRRAILKLEGACDSNEGKEELGLKATLAFFLGSSKT